MCVSVCMCVLICACVCVCVCVCVCERERERERESESEWASMCAGVCECVCKDKFACIHKPACIWRIFTTLSHSSVLECDSVIGQVVTCIVQDSSAFIFRVKQSQKMEWPWWWWQSDHVPQTGTFQTFLLVIEENKTILGLQVHSIGTMFIPNHVQTCHLVSQKNWGDLFISSLQWKISKLNFILITNCHYTSATCKQCKRTLHWKPEQFTSSELSPQSSSRSQRHRLGIHLLLAQRNSDSEHSR